MEEIIEKKEEECGCYSSIGIFCSKHDNKMDIFRKELESLINKHSIENFSNTPDFIIADYMMNCLEAYHSIYIKNRDWHTK